MSYSFLRCQNHDQALCRRRYISRPGFLCALIAQLKYTGSIVYLQASPSAVTVNNNFVAPSLRWHVIPVMATEDESPDVAHA